MDVDFVVRLNIFANQQRVDISGFCRLIRIFEQAAVVTNNNRELVSIYNMLCRITGLGTRDAEGNHDIKSLMNGIVQMANVSVAGKSEMQILSDYHNCMFWRGQKESLINFLLANRTPVTNALLNVLRRSIQAPGQPMKPTSRPGVARLINARTPAANETFLEQFRSQGMVLGPFDIVARDDLPGISCRYSNEGREEI